MKLYLISQNVNTGYGTWASPENVHVVYIGTAKPGIMAGAVICASFNAG